VGGWQKKGTFRGKKLPVLGNGGAGESLLPGGFDKVSCEEVLQQYIEDRLLQARLFLGQPVQDCEPQASVFMPQGSGVRALRVWRSGLRAAS